MKPTCTAHWKNYLESQPNFAARYAVLFVLVLVVFYSFTQFLDWNETRTGGYQVNDLVLQSFKARNVSIPIFIGTYFGVISGLICGLSRPRLFLNILVAAFLIVVARVLSLYLVPLVEPDGMIPLRDFLLEGTFYSGKVMRRDLFFSGHTANIFLLAFLTPKSWLKKTLFVVGTIVGVLLLVQKVHYTIDVVAAPFVAYGVAKLTFILIHYIRPFFGFLPHNTTKLT